MKILPQPPRFSNQALTRIEAITVFAVMILLCVLGWSVFKRQSTFTKKSAEISCVNNLREIGVFLTMYADDNNGRFPLQEPTTSNNAAEFIGSEKVFPRYRLLWNTNNFYKARYSAGLLVCPFDAARQRVMDSEILTDSNISYFFNADAVRNSTALSLLCGDRFLKSGGQSVTSGVLLVTTNAKITWTPSEHRGGGNVLWTDGSVQQTTTPALKTILQSLPFSTNRFLIP